MPKQKNVVTGRGNARPRKGGRAGSTAVHERQNDSPTLAPAPTGMKLRINFGGQAKPHEQKSAAPLPAFEDLDRGAQDPDEEEAPEELPTEAVTYFPAVETTRRSGRAVKKRQADDYVFGSELDNQVELSSVGKIDNDEDEAEYRDLRSSPRK